MCWKKAHVLLYNILIQDSRSRNNGGYFMLQNTRTPLDGGWKLRYVENKRFRKENKDISIIAALKLTGWQSVDAVVPETLSSISSAPGSSATRSSGATRLKTRSSRTCTSSTRADSPLRTSRTRTPSSSSRESTLSRTYSSTGNSSDRPTICSSPLSFAERT